MADKMQMQSLLPEWVEILNAVGRMEPIDWIIFIYQCLIHIFNLTIFVYITESNYIKDRNIEDDEIDIVKLCNRKNILNTLSFFYFCKNSIDCWLAKSTLLFPSLYRQLFSIIYNISQIKIEYYVMDVK